MNKRAKNPKYLKIQENSKKSVPIKLSDSKTARKTAKTAHNTAKVNKRREIFVSIVK